MKLFELQLKNPEMDQISSMLVIANSEREARILADEFATNCKTAWLDPANPSIWLNEKFSSCQEIDINKSSIVHYDQITSS